MPRDDGFPSYRAQLREVLRAKIEEGEYPPGTAIPSEKRRASACQTARKNRREATRRRDRLSGIVEGFVRQNAAHGPRVGVEQHLEVSA